GADPGRGQGGVRSPVPAGAGHLGGHRAAHHGRDADARPAGRRGRANRAGGHDHRLDPVLPADVLLRPVRADPVDAAGAPAHQPRHTAGRGLGVAPGRGTWTLAVRTGAADYHRVSGGVRTRGGQALPLGVTRADTAFKSGSKQAEDAVGGPWDRIFSEQWHEGQLRLARAMVDVVPYVMLAFSAILTPILYHEHWETGSPIPPLVLCALAGLWTLWMYTLHPAWRDRPRLMGVFVGVLLVIMTVMVAWYSWLGFYTFTGYYYVYRLVGSWPWRFACLGLLAGLSGISQGLGLQGAFSLARVLVLGGTISVNVLGACALAWFTWASYKQDLLRMRLFDELAETNARLESTIAENTGLHRQPWPRHARPGCSTNAS